ncbi:MAG: phosphate signaling complex protein PhoU [Candidatus Dormibacteraeota bacterium]|nr:phosphate signaling complex protein PhoU [Candidatus Dormibacteraeota bacterium]
MTLRNAGLAEGASKTEIERRTLAMGRRVAQALEAALQALAAGDMAAADGVVRTDSEVNSMRYEIEDQVVEALVGDTDPARVRLLVAVLSVINDLERIGDHAEGVAKVALMLGRPPDAGVAGDLFQLGRMTVHMLDDGLAALAERDAERARVICDADDAVDQLYDQLCSELLISMHGRPAEVVPTTYLLWVAHNLERIADRVTNICERTVYLVSGRVEELNVSNY